METQEKLNKLTKGGPREIATGVFDNPNGSGRLCVYFNALQITGLILLHASASRFSHFWPTPSHLIYIFFYYL